MKKALLIALMAICAAIVACQPVEKQTGAMPLTEKDIAAIKAIGPALDKAVLALNWNTALDLFTEDGVWMLANTPIIQGRSAMMEHVKSYVGLAVSEHRIVFSNVTGYGDIAYATGTYSETYSIEGATEPIIDKGKMLSTFRKQPDGSWAMSIWSLNSDLPLPE